MAAPLKSVAVDAARVAVWAFTGRYARSTRRTDVKLFYRAIKFVDRERHPPVQQQIMQRGVGISSTRT